MKVIILTILAIIWFVTYIKKPSGDTSFIGFIKNRGLNIAAFAAFLFVSIFW